MNEAVSSDFWRFSRAGTTRRLSIPNGDTCDYETYTMPNMLRVTSCQDLFGNDLIFEWSASPPKLTIKQELDDAVFRLVVLEFATSTSSFPTKMIYKTDENNEEEDREWVYDLSNNLISVIPPEGLAGRSAYDAFGLNTLTTPFGGVIEYTYENSYYDGPDSPQTLYWTLVVNERETSGQGIEEGTWDYTYDIGQNGLSGQTTVQTPTARILYEHGTGESPLNVFDGEGGVLQLVSRTVQSFDGTQDLEHETRTYTFVPVLSWGQFGTFELDVRTVTRDDGGTAFATDYTYDENNFGDYHQPKSITETGTGLTRTTNRSFKPPSSSPYLVGLPATETMTVGTDTFEKSWTYDSATGFKTAETIYSIETEFTPDSRGNVRTIEKANDKITVFTPAWASQDNLDARYLITRTINPDGTIGTQTIGGRTTSFEYDDLGRLTETQPPGANPTIVDYDNGEVDTECPESVRTARGAAESFVCLDGFGGGFAPSIRWVCK